MKIKIAVLGAGSWGTALALLLARNNHQVHLWARDPILIADMRNNHCNERYLPGVPFDGSIVLHDDLAECLQATQEWVLAVPSHAFAELLDKIAVLSLEVRPLLWATKGLEPQHGSFFHELIAKKLGEGWQAALLSGPSFAKEVALGLPTAVVVAAATSSVASFWAQRFHNPHFRVYVSLDLIGVQLGAVLKNIFAVATGIAEGLGYGANAKAALMTRGLAELLRLGQALGASADTLVGLAGCGDMILTCTDNQSRNRRFGLALGRGLTVDEAIKQIGQVIEAVHNTQQVMLWAIRTGIELPIVEQVALILSGEVTPQAAAHALFARKPKVE